MKKILLMAILLIGGYVGACAQAIKKDIKYNYKQRIEKYKAHFV